MRSHAHLIVAADFFTTEVWTAKGLVRYDHGVAHQGVGNMVLRGRARREVGEVAVTERIGGLLKYYHRAAA